MKKLILILLCTMLFMDGCASERLETSAGPAAEADTMQTTILNEQTYYLIKTESDLTAIGTAYPLSGNYLLDQNITLTQEWQPIGNEQEPFTGIMDGYGYTISGLTVTERSDSMGFFGACDGAVIRNLVLEDAHILEGTNVNLGPGFAIAAFAVDTEITDCSIQQRNSGEDRGEP